jgi:hypothetical protein
VEIASGDKIIIVIIIIMNNGSIRELKFNALSVAKFNIRHNQNLDKNLSKINLFIA